MIDKTSVNIELIISGDYFEIDCVSKIIGLNPTAQWKKGDPVGKKPIRRSHTCWTYAIGNRETLDITTQWEAFLSEFKDKSESIRQVGALYQTEILILVTIFMYDEISPYMTLSNDVMEFANSIGARVDFDLYFY